MHREDKKIQEGSVLEQLGATSFESLAPNIIEQIGSAFFKGASLGQIDPLELSGREATIPGAEIVGEFAGATIPIIRGFKLARLLIRAAENPSLVARLGQGAVVGGAFGGLEKIPDEKSRVANIIEGATFFAGIEVGFGVLGRIGRLFKRKPGPLTETDKKALEKAVEKASPAEKESLEKAITSEKPTEEPLVSPVKDTAKRDKRVQENIERIEKAKPKAKPEAGAFDFSLDALKKAGTARDPKAKIAFEAGKDAAFLRIDSKGKALFQVTKKGHPSLDSTMGEKGLVDLGLKVPKVPKAKPKGEPQTIISFIRASGGMSRKSLVEKGITFKDDRSLFLSVARNKGRGADDLPAQN